MKTMGVLMLVVILACPVFGQAKPQTKPRATLQQQKMCAEQAQKAFEDYRTSNGFWSYTNHFDASTNVCYMEIDYADEAYSAITVYDAFEKRAVASYMGDNKGILGCHVGVADCKSLGGFLILLDKRFGVGQWR